MILHNQMTVEPAECSLDSNARKFFKKEEKNGITEKRGKTVPVSL